MSSNQSHTSVEEGPREGLYRFGPHFSLGLLLVAAVARLFISGSVPNLTANAAINALWVIGATLLVATTQHCAGPIYLRRGLKPLLFFLLCGWASLLYSDNYAATWQQLIDFTLPALALTALLLVASRAMILNLFSAVLASSLGVALHATYQYFVSLPLTRQNLAEHTDFLNSLGPLKSMFLARVQSDEIFAAFVNPNSLGIFVVVALLAAVVLTFGAFTHQRRGLALLGVTISLALAWVLFLTKSKGSYGSLALALLLAGFCTIPSRRWRWGAAAALSLLAGLYLVGNWSGAFLSMEVRWHYWLAGAQMWLDAPLLGRGLGTFADYYTSYKTIGGWESQKAHNNFLQILCELGVVGGISFLYLSLCAFWQRGADAPVVERDFIAKPMRFCNWALVAAVVLAAVFSYGDNEYLFAFTPQHHLPGLILLLLLLLVGFAFFARSLALLKMGEQQRLFKLLLVALLIHSVIDYDLYVPALYMVTLLLLVLIFAAQPLRSVECGPGGRRGLQLAAFGLGALVYFFLVYPSFAQAKLLAATSGFKKPTQEQKLQRYLLALELGPASDQLLIDAGFTALKMLRVGVRDFKGRPTAQLAEECARRAVELNPHRAGNWVNLANTLWALLGPAARAEVIECYTKAVERYPYKPLYRLTLAEQYRDSGERAAALVMAIEARRINGLITDHRTLLSEKDLARLEKLIASLTDDAKK